MQIRLVVGPDEVGHLIGAENESHGPDEPGSEALVSDPAGSGYLQASCRTPPFFEGAHAPIEVLPRNTPGVVVLFHVVGVAVEKYEGADPLGMGG
jgi:hypothetical protein